MEANENYEWNGVRLTDENRNAIKDYVGLGIRPGHFLSSCLANDLQKAFSHADSSNLNQIPVIVKYIYNRIPSACWGSWQAIDDWVKIKSR